MTDREILERLLVSLQFCENDGDVAEVVIHAAKLAGIEVPYNDDDEIDWGDRPGLWT